LGTLDLSFQVHKSIDISVENGKFISFPNGSVWFVTSGDTKRALALSSLLPEGGICSWLTLIFEN